MDNIMQDRSPKAPDSSSTMLFLGTEARFILEALKSHMCQWSCWQTMVLCSTMSTGTGLSVVGITVWPTSAIHRYAVKKDRQHQAWQYSQQWSAIGLTMLLDGRSIEVESSNKQTHTAPLSAPFTAMRSATGERLSIMTDTSQHQSTTSSGT